jgi:glycerophosphoryl diester phosphodiesterase
MTSNSAHNRLQDHLAATDFVIIGHRGAAGLQPENTLLSFKTALRWGCPMVELDVYACTDDDQQQQLLVIHDDKLHRTTDGSGRVMEHSVAQLRTLDAGQGQQIPLLAEVIELLCRHNLTAAQTCALNIELKGPATAAPTARLIESLPDLTNTPLIIVSSFDHDELREFHRLAPTCPVAVLYDRYREDWLTTARELNAFAVNISRRIAKSERIQDMRNAGYRVFVYTVNEPEEGEKLAALGASGIFTDRPDLFLPEP